jgi:DNA-binding YbaB/EbfC family protein
MSLNPMELLKNFQNIQARMNEMQQRLAQVRVTGSSGGGIVQVGMNGQMAVTSVTISPDVVDPNDVEMLQDLVLAAVSDALAKVKEKMKEEAASVTGGMELPPGFMGM